MNCFNFFILNVYDFSVGHTQRKFRCIVLPRHLALGLFCICIMSKNVKKRKKENEKRRIILGLWHLEIYYSRFFDQGLPGRLENLKAND